MLVLVTDDARAETLQVMPKTRRWLADGGVAFTQGFATTPSCCPSRASIMSGRYVHNHGCSASSSATGSTRDTLARYLSAGGYRTAMAGKFLNRWSLRRPPPHFDRYAQANGGYYDQLWQVDGAMRRVPTYSTTFIGDQALDYLEEFEGDDARPWFLYLAPFAPHDPRVPEPRYAAASFPELERVGGGGEAEVAGAPAYLRQRPPADPGEVAALRTGQARTLLSVDDLVDRVMGRLQATGELDDTLVFYLSDNGYSWGEHRHVGKFVPYTESIKVPFLVRWPGRLPAGTVDDRLVATVDIKPTVLAAAGIRPDPGDTVDGRSLLDGGRRERLLAEYWRDQANAPGVRDWAALRAPGWQYVENYDQPGGGTFREFYDLAATRGWSGTCSPTTTPATTRRPPWPPSWPRPAPARGRAAHEPVAATELRRPELAWLAEVLWGPTPEVEWWWAAGPRRGAGVPAVGGASRPAPPAGAGAAGLGAGRRRGGPPVQRRHDPAGPAGQGGGRPRPGQRRPPLVAAPPRPGRGRRRAGRRDPARRPRPGGPRPVRPGGRDRPRPGPAQPQAGGAAHRPRRPAGRLHEGRLERPHPAPGPGRGRHAPAARPAPTRAASPPPTCSTRANGRAWTSPSARPCRTGCGAAAAATPCPRWPSPARSPPSAGSRRRRWGRAAGGPGCGPAWPRSARPCPTGPPTRRRARRGCGRPGAAAALDGTLERLEGLAGTRLVFGTWHGDWGPWNLRATPGRLLVWDWERSADRVPLGFDLLHFGYQTALQGLGQPPATAAATGRDRAAPHLAELGQRPGVAELLCDLYLLERLCRAAEAEVSAVTGRPDTVGAALLGVLGRRLVPERSGGNG